MSRMLDLIRISALPSNVMQAASKGSLAVPAPEMIEILVYLANHNKIFGQQAQLTLAGWDETASRAAAADPVTPKEVLNYMISPKNLRPILLPALLENPSVSVGSLVELAASSSRDVAEIMLKSERVKRSSAIQEALRSNPNVPASGPVQIPDSTTDSREAGVTAEAAPGAPAPTPVAGPDEVLSRVAAVEVPVADDVLEEGILAYLAEHQGEISAEGEKAFQPIGGFYDELVPDGSVREIEEPLAEPAAKSSATAGAAAARKALIKKASLSPDEQRGSALQKISKLDIKGRIQLAMKGNKEERSLLVRDGTKVVALAVLESPKITDGEVERFATQKNVLEAVLRGIPMKRRFAKNYVVVRNLVFNPRTPIDLSVTLIKNLLVNDLRNLSGNKEVSDTVRKLALKMFKQKLDAAAGRR
jgi:hypothetical protein